MADQRTQKEAVNRLKRETLETKRLCEVQMLELEGQMQDLTFFLKTQHEVSSLQGTFVSRPGFPSSYRIRTHAMISDHGTAQSLQLTLTVSGR